MPNRLSARGFVFVVLTLIFFCSLPTLLPRLRVEKENQGVAVIADWRDIPPLARSAGMSSAAALETLKEKGLGGLMVGEFTGEDILDGLAPVTMTPTTASPADGAAGSAGAFFSIPGDLPFASELAELLALRAGTPPFAMKGTNGGMGIGVIMPVPADSLRKNGLVPDLEGLNAAGAAALPVFYRIAPAQTWQLRQALEVTKRIFETWPNIEVAAPSGEIALGYPDMKPLASLLKEHRIPAAQVEFSRQPGASALNALAFPDLLPLHSVTNEELLARGIGRLALRERLTRAAVERSVRLLVLRPAVSGNVESALAAFGDEIAALADSLTARGLRLEWPKPFSVDLFTGRTARFMSALACALAFMLAGTRLLMRMKGAEKDAVRLREVAVFLVFSCILAVGVWKIPAGATLVAALASAFIVTEASLTAMSDSGRPWRSLAEAFLFAAVGGLSLAALFGVPVYMLRLRTFSGVKLTLMLPLLLVLLHDLRRRVHPESLTEILSRPPLFGELFLGLGLVVLMGIVLFRSDNVQFIPGIEAKIRNTLERVLIARPRNREIFIGYPCFLLYVFAVRAGLWTRWRELLRLGVVTGFASVVNSFCHFHTRLLFTLLREFHGLWVGVILGVCAVAGVKYLLLPLWRRLRFLAE